MNIKPIKTKKDYQKALNHVEDVFDSRPRTRDGDELDTLGLLIEKYEDGHYPIQSI